MFFVGFCHVVRIYLYPNETFRYSREQTNHQSARNSDFFSLFGVR